ncbi:uncharacterized protein LOC142978548 isoform X2 [Anticarsia gemmatalis]
MKQVDVMLSNMMNELTKTFVTASELLKGNSPGHLPGVVTEASTSRRKLASRFKVQRQKERPFFEHIYTNMTNDYKKFYNTTAHRVDRSGRDPCEHQEEIKYLWKSLLDKSMMTLRRAMRHCIKAYLKEEGIPLKSKKGKEIAQFFVQELPHIKTKQLNVLCEKYQLCYDELVRFTVVSD